MPLGSWLSVVLFLVTVAPGLLFDSLEERRRASYVESAFREFSRIVVASLILGALSLAALSALRVAWPDALPSLKSLVLDRDAYLSQNFGLVVRGLFAHITLSLAFAWVAHRLLAARDGDTIRQVSAWRKVFKLDCPRGHDVHVRARLDDAVYIGRVAYYSPDMSTTDRELVLAPPILAGRHDNQASVKPLPVDYQRVILRGEAIDLISVAYLPALDPQPTTKANLLRRLTASFRRTRHQQPQPPDTPSPGAS